MNRRHTFAIAIFISLYIFCLSLSTGVLTDYITSLFSGTAIFISLFLQIQMFRRVSPPLKTFILFFIIGTSSYLLAEVTWTYQVLLLDNYPIPSPSDIFYDLNTISYIIGFIYLAYVTSQRLHFINFLLDVTIIYKTIVVLLTVYFFVPQFKANGFLPIEITMATLYPALIILLNIAIIICYYDKNFILPKKSMLIFFLAALIQLLGDTLFAISYYQSSFTAGSLLDPLWSLTILLYGYGVYSLKETVGNLTEPSDKMPSYLSFKSSMYRMVLQGLCILLLVFSVIYAGNVVLQITLVLTIILVLIRQILSSLYIHQLLQSISTLKVGLEVKVKQRTEQLSKKNNELLYAFEQINYMAYHDDLTGLPNRRALYDKMENYKLKQQPFTLLFIDIDKFKEINDTYGHMCGDEFLISFSKGLTNTIKNEGFVYRQAGDEFVIIFEETNKDIIEEMMRRLDYFSKEPFLINEQEVVINFSIGKAQYPIDTTDITKIIKLADNEMYKAKKGITT
ncbi:GGDEF domain-containing protein [Anaerobacillus alkaliphilus]|uniref:GGDEF domain-containing protein n=1 Tax=Anaerobacillus alkaliphilus TaxID=1548597 RepID=A0A4Q0VVM6_9BACI|nr:GGDEF domain-containing protein [Anaerobacillus alkaliphilus]RXJ02587.1 GGDEF domain-containing protein [Anaerobacillus alkaliphilus]